jgi:hypothetical protein
MKAFQRVLRSKRIEESEVNVVVTIFGIFSPKIEKQLAIFLKSNFTIFSAYLAVF